MGVEQDKLIVRWRRAAERGDVRRACDLASLLLDFRRSESSRDEARKWALVAMAHPDPEEPESLACRFIWSDGIGGWHRPRALGPDPAFGLGMLRSLARRKLASPMYALHLVYLRGAGVRRDVARAEHWARAAARYGDGEALDNLGVSLFYGEGVTRNRKRAVRCYRYAAKHGHVKAAANLALCYKLGTGVAKNEARFIELARRAARAGNVRSSVQLACAWIEGRGCKRDPARGLRVLRALADKSVEDALESLNEFEPKLEHVGANSSKQAPARRARKRARVRVLVAH